MTDWLKVRIAERRIEAEDIAAFILEPADPPVLPHYEPGAHIDVKLPNGMVRQYSLCGTPARPDRFEIAVLREAAGRGGSACVHDQLQQGSEIEISAPRNLFPLTTQERALLFAGGIGITPILAMAEHLSRAGTDFEMHYCTRTAARAAFRSRLDTAPFAPQVTYHFDDQPETALDVGSLLAGHRAGTHLYVCGPNGFMDHVLNNARAAGWPESAIHFERFSAPISGPGQDGAFEIEIEGSGRLVTVAADQSALEALADAGFDIPASCEQGICGTCVTPVVEGIPDHRDMFLSQAERAANDCFTPCCSRALTARLTIQL